MIVLCQFVQAGRIGFQQRRHLVDKRPRAARAHAVHALFQSAGEIDNLRVLAAQFDGDVGLRRGLLQRFPPPQRPPVRTRRAALPPAKLRPIRSCAPSRGTRRVSSALPASSPPVSPYCAQWRRYCPPDHFSCFVQQHQLDGGRTDVNARIIIGVCFHFGTSSVGLFRCHHQRKNARKMIGFSFCTLCRFSHSEVQSGNRFNSPSTAKNPLAFAGKSRGFLFNRMRLLKNMIFR